VEKLVPKDNRKNLFDVPILIIKLVRTKSVVLTQSVESKNK